MPHSQACQIFVPGQGIKFQRKKNILFFAVTTISKGSVQKTTNAQLSVLFPLKAQKKSCMNSSTDINPHGAKPCRTSPT